jgi:hypothetical protein
MARASSSSDSSSQIRHIVGDFVGQLSALIEQDAVARARATILSAFSGGDAPNLTPNGKRRGRPPGSGRRAVGPVLALAGVMGRKRRKAPIQLCPVPGCTNRAAPVFGMVCSKHRDLPKMEIRKFREARRAKKDKAEGKAPAMAKAGRKPAKAKTKAMKRKPRVVRAAPRSATPAPAKPAATA